ncbi:putative efflux protein, MATE family [Halovivax ruber XH-70]|uniref:Multidrug-efflux transporter n=1 Tax=Halovivax ruber (strain DSM 18193 / JCM 13892 / XH-70) TaxID=797302 RepID=L0IB82_HALRX|nr:MATE family efflux transporter [Halovivax ruber]AGB15501.1 putative efflux protein, MATE family [Halovivax ruber XH-70]
MSSETDRSVNVTDGDLFKPLMVLSAPIVGSQVLNVGYNMADTFWVGRLGGDAIAALSYSWAVVFLMISVGGGLTVAGTVLIAQNKGAGKTARASHIAGQTLAFVTVVALALATVGYLLTPWLMRMVGADPGGDAYAFAVGYTRIMFVGIAFMFWFFIFDALSRGWGDTRTPLYLMAISVGLNVVIDPVLILGFDGNPLFAWLGLTDLESSLYAATGFTGWGVDGAAIATIFSRAVAAIIGLFLLFSGRVGLEPSLSDLWLERETVRKILDIGAPIATEQGFRAFGITVLTAIIALAGTEAVAAYGIVTRLSSLLYMPALGLARGTETVVGQNLGADQVDRAKRAVKLSSMVIVGVFVVVIAIAYPYAEAIAGVFITPDAENADVVIEYAAAYVFIAGPSYVFLGVFQILLGGLRGSGSTKAAMVLSVQELWVWRIPIAIVAVVAFEMGVVGVWYAVAISFVASAIVTGLWFLRGTWTDNVVEEDVATPVAGD